jgi:hypothetical protein
MVTVTVIMIGRDDQHRPSESNRIEGIQGQCFLNKEDKGFSGSLLDIALHVLRIDFSPSQPADLCFTRFAASLDPFALWQIPLHALLPVLKGGKAKGKRQKAKGPNGGRTCSDHTR